MPLVTPTLGEIPQLLEAQLRALIAAPAGATLLALGLLLLALTALRVAIGLLGFVYSYWLRPERNLKRYGGWAVVTGATDGIGKAYCEQLARKGLNVVLISRTESKLQDCAAELRERYGVEARVCSADLSKATPETFAKIGAALEGLEVGILVNNAGVSYDHPEYLGEVDDQAVYDMVAVNALVPAMLSKMVLPGMRERGRGVIINVGSGAATIIPTSPLLSVYAGTKAFVDCFSRSLDAEYAPLGVRVQNQAPLFVATKMSKIRRARLDAPTPDAWAAAAVRQIGRESSFTPYWFHGLQRVFVRLAPDWLINRQVMGIHQGLRSRYYRRLAKQQAEAAVAAAGEAAEGAAEGEGEDAAAGGTKRELRRRK
ncbi:hypothetical protein ABPG75_006140 [Micractinium tetrahymenae]